MSSTKSPNLILEELGSQSLKKRFAIWSARLAEPGITERDHSQIRDWACGASIALLTLGYDDLADAADEIWNPRSAR